MTREEQKHQTEEIIILIKKGVEPKDIAECVGCCLAKVYNTAKGEWLQNNKKDKKKRHSG